jgi:hypothetical protein
MTELSEPLRPMTLGEILDRTAQLYRRNFLLFAGVAALPIAAMVGLVAVAAIFGVAIGVAAKSSMPTSLATGAAAIVIVLLVVPLYIAIYVFSIGGLTQAAVSVHRGEKLTIRAALASVKPHFWRYLGFLFLQIIVVALVPAVIAGALAGPLIYLASRTGAGIATGAAMGLVIFLVVAAAAGVIVWLALSCSMGFAVCVVEDRPAWDSLMRAMKLSKGTRGRIFVMFLLVAALALAASTISYIVSLMVIAVSSAVGNGAQYAAIGAVIAGVLQIVVSFGVQSLLTPVSWIALVLFYYDQRIRTEGYDIEWMMERAGMTQLAHGAPAVDSGSISGPAAAADTVEER